MDLSYPAEADEFRGEIQAWLATQLPPGWFDGTRPAGADWVAFATDWNEMIHREGWATPTWPVEHGGRGLTQLQAVVLAEELTAAGAPI